MSHVRISYDMPSFTIQTNALGVLNMLEVYRTSVPDAKFYQASSSEMYGNSVDDDGIQRLTTPMNPVSPYGCAKLYAYNLCRTYRASYNMFISNGILFNHESPRRGLNFVTNKIVEGAVNIKKGKQKTLALGNLDATRDWGHAKDYVRAMWIMLQADAAGDFVCATGESYSVRHLCDLVFYKLDIDVGKYVTIDEKYFRPTELHDLRGDCSKLKRVLGWEPEYTFDDLIEEMIEARL